MLNILDGAIYDYFSKIAGTDRSAWKPVRVQYSIGRLEFGYIVDRISYRSISVLVMADAVRTAQTSGSR